MMSNTRSTTVGWDDHYRSSLLRQRWTETMKLRDLFGSLILACFVTAGCVENAAPSKGLPADEDLMALSRCSVESSGDNIGVADADLAWAELAAVRRSSRKDKESDLAHLVRDLELANQCRRELGLQFWSDYPLDRRRYQWLLFAVHLAPDYPLDLDDWVEKESWLGVNAAAVDTEAEDRWRSEYEKLRSEFLASDQVTDQERRFLRFGELRTQLQSLLRATAREEPVSVLDYLGALTEYALAFPEPLSDQDSGDFDTSLSSLLLGVYRHADDLGLTEADLDELITELSDVSPYVSESIDGILGLWRALAQMGSHNSSISASSTEVGEYWNELRALALPTPPVSPSTPVGRIIYHMERLIARRKHREIGSVLWERYPDPVYRRSWYHQTLQIAPSIYAAELPALDPATDFSRYTDFRVIEFDHELRNRWRDKLSAYRSSVWADTSDMGPELFASFREIEIRNDLWNAVIDDRLAGGNSNVLKVLDGLHELYRSFGPSRMFRSLSVGVVRDPAFYGLSTEDIRTFLEPMEGYSDERLHGLAEGFERTIRLRETPLSFSAPTLAGEVFDLADLRGHIVLMEYWSTSCASCIAAMPRIHDVYLDYRERGFEVVSVSFDADSNRRRVERIEHELGLTWTTLNAEAQWEEANERFGWGGVLPAYMLLDREGRLVANTGEVDYGRNLRALLDEILAAEVKAAD